MQKYGTINDNEGSRLGVRGYHTGGRVQGFGTGDIVPAFLEPGEFVVKKDVAKQYEPELQRLNEGGYNKGGQVNGGDYGRARDNIQRDGSGWLRGSSNIPLGSPRGLQNGGGVPSKILQYTGFKKGELLERLTARNNQGDDLFPGLAQLLVDPFIEVATDYQAPPTVFNRLWTSDESIRPMDDEAKASTLHLPPGITGDDLYQILLQFNSLYRDFPEWEKHLADVGVHETGHILSFAKTFGFDDPSTMPNVPLHSREKHYGMAEGFSEFLRSRYSTERNRFPNGLTQEPKIITDLSVLSNKIEANGNPSLTDLLTTKSDYIARNITPSILHHADKEGHLGYLMDHYNELVRAIPKSQDEGTEEYIGYLENAINKTFIRKQIGGRIPGYGGGDRVPALLEAGEYIINKQSANRYHSVLEAINSKGIQGFANGGLVYAADGFGFGSGSD